MNTAKRLSLNEWICLLLSAHKWRMIPVSWLVRWVHLFPRKLTRLKDFLQPLVSRNKRHFLTTLAAKFSHLEDWIKKKVWLVFIRLFLEKLCGSFHFSLERNSSFGTQLKTKFLVKTDIFAVNTSAASVSSQLSVRPHTHEEMWNR